MSSVVMGESFERLAVTSLTVMLAMETGWSPSLVTTKKMGSRSCAAKSTEKILVFSGVS